MKRCALLLLIVVAGLVVGADDAKDDATKNDVKKFQGTWVMVSGMEEGKKLSEKEMKGSSLTVDGDQHTVKVAGKTHKGTHKLDATKKPKTIDITDTEGPFKGTTIRAIYELSGDEFKICYAPANKDRRPKDFKAAAGTGYYVHVWKREKK
jgi:uncharacterized protein (TIGR03067 family)